MGLLGRPSPFSAYVAIFLGKEGIFTNGTAQMCAGFVVSGSGVPVEMAERYEERGSASPIGGLLRSPPKFYLGPLLFGERLAGRANLCGLN
jgi:hypothetical protein